MAILRWNDTDICTSLLTQRAYRAATCDMLGIVNPENKDETLRAFADSNNRLSGLRVSGIADLSFLADFPNLRYLEVVDQKKVNTRYLDGLSNLRGLHLESAGAGIDFACFPELEVYVGDWHAGHVNLQRCRELHQLRLWQFKPKSQDLSSLTNIVRLEWLTLTQTAVTNLAGVATLKDLRYLGLANASKLESLEALALGELELREVAIENAKKIAAYAPLAKLRQLRRLKLFGCAAMPNLQWTQGMDWLDTLSIVETNVDDGDLSPLLKLPQLRYVGVMDKKHHSHKFQALNAILEQRAESDS